MLVIMRTLKYFIHSVAFYIDSSRDMCYIIGEGILLSRPHFLLSQAALLFRAL